MKLTPPKVVTWVVALIIGVIGVIGKLGGFLTDGLSFWLVVVAFAILILATLWKDL